ncbi:MAG: hypothetical protein EAS49_14550, partial [Brucella intermedia]
LRTLGTPLKSRRQIIIGIVGKVQKVVDDNELEVEIAEGVRIRVMRSTLMDVRVKGEPVADNKNK